MDDETRAYLDEMRRELAGHFGVVDRRLEALERHTRRSGNANAIASLRLEMLAGFQGRDVVVRAAFAEVRRDIEELRQRL